MTMEEQVTACELIADLIDDYMFLWGTREAAAKLDADIDALMQRARALGRLPFTVEETWRILKGYEARP